jgi:hypothetical protein
MQKVIRALSIDKSFIAKIKIRALSIRAIDKSFIY